LEDVVMAKTDDQVPVLAEGWLPFRHQRDVPTDGTWFAARTAGGTVRIVHYANKSHRFPIDHSEEMWPTEPVEWMPLEAFARHAAPYRARIAELEEAAAEMLVAFADGVDWADKAKRAAYEKLAALTPEAKGDAA
jgi:hypothetical protein